MEAFERYQLAKKTASVVGDRIADLHFEELQIEFKDERSEDPVTNLDKLAQQLIIKSIRETFISDNVYAEEEQQQQKALDSKNLWIIDPIDGTANFMHGSPFWGVSIAYAEKGHVLFGVVYCPELHFMYEAFEDRGSFLNEKPINVSKTNLMENSLITSGITHSLKNEVKDKEAKLKMFLKLFEKSQRLRIFGSSVLQICEVAAGHSDAFIGTGLKPWDFAAANKILTEAGGKTTDFNNLQARLTHQDLICSNSLIHEEIAGMMK